MQRYFGPDPVDTQIDKELVLSLLSTTPSDVYAEPITKYPVNILFDTKSYEKILKEIDFPHGYTKNLPKWFQKLIKEQVNGLSNKLGFKVKYHAAADLYPLQVGNKRWKSPDFLVIVESTANRIVNGMHPDSAGRCRTITTEDGTPESHALLKSIEFWMDQFNETHAPGVTNYTAYHELLHCLFGLKHPLEGNYSYTGNVQEAMPIMGLSENFFGYTQCIENAHRQRNNATPCMSLLPTKPSQEDMIAAAEQIKLMEDPTYKSPYWSERRPNWMESGLKAFVSSFARTFVCDFVMPLLKERWDHSHPELNRLIKKIITEVAAEAMCLAINTGIYGFSTAAFVSMANQIIKTVKLLPIPAEAILVICNAVSAGIEVYNDSGRALNFITATVGSVGGTGVAYKLFGLMAPTVRRFLGMPLELQTSQVATPGYINR